jgi:hypothetical protein
VTSSPERRTALDVAALVEDDDQRAGDLEVALRAVALLAQRALGGDRRRDVGEGEDDAGGGAAAGVQRPCVDPQPLGVAVAVDPRRGAGDWPALELGDRRERLAGCQGAAVVLGDDLQVILERRDGAG